MIARHVPDEKWLQFLDDCERTMKLRVLPQSNITAMSAAERYADVDWKKESTHAIARRLGVSNTAVWNYGLKHGFLKRGKKK